MIYCLSGELLFTDAVASTAVIDCCGVGYKVTVTSNTLRKLPMNPEKPPRIRLLTYMQVREDGVDLFGFYTAEELDMFKMLISVSGVGPKAAVSILSLMTPEKLSLSIATEDVKAISKAPGVGAKTAGRIILDLKDKVAKAFPAIESAEDTSAPTAPSAAGTSKMSDAQSALLSLGYSRQEISAALAKVDTSASLEDIIRLALNVLLRQ
jgi:Holliday junction DNA helicase RuvA